MFASLGSVAMDDVQGLVRSLLSQAHRKISNGEAMAALEVLFAGGCFEC